MVHVHTHNQNPQALRGQIAKMLGVTIDKVVVHSYPGPRTLRRSNGGNAGAEDEAVILSQAVGKPVRVQWMRADDMQWSTQSPAAFSDVELAVDEQGKLAAYQIDHYMPADAGRPAGGRGAGGPAHHACPGRARRLRHFNGEQHIGSSGSTPRLRTSSSAGMELSRWARKRRRLP